MGCTYSRIFEEDPRIFYVWNVDGEGRPVKPGKIEVTDTQLILYQKENVVVRWPLTSLRRYGFDSQVFSFECGRRCTTGAGVYAFKCRRAQALFTILQECINNSGGTGTGEPQNDASTVEQQHLNSLSRPPVPTERPIPTHSNSLPNNVLGQSNSPTEDADGYLEPITANSHLHYPSSLSRTNTNGLGSPGGYVCIHGESSQNADWPSLTNSLPSNIGQCCSHGHCRSVSVSSSTHHYVNNEVIDSQGAKCQCIVNQYVNATVVANELPHQCCSSSNKCCTEQNQNTYVNSSIVTLGPVHLSSCSSGCCANCVDFNTNYAKLDDLLKQEQSAKKYKDQQHFYVNVKPDVPSTKCASGRSSPTEQSCGTLTSPTSPVSAKDHCYANLGSNTPETKEQAQVNYAVLDLDQTEASNSVVLSPASTHNSVHSLLNSPVKSPEGYAQIDFDKTVALSISANPCAAFNDDSIRKTRHNAVIQCASMSA